MKYQNNTHKIWLTLAIFLFISSCDLIDSLKKDKKDDEDQVEFVGGISRDILDFVSATDLAILEDTLGIQIHRGNNPPKLNGSYKISPVILKKTNIQNDYSIGFRFSDSYLKFYNQDDALFTIELDHAEVNFTDNQLIGMGVGRGSFLIGNGSAFSIFSKVVYEQASGEKADLLYLYSGVYGTNGIHDFEYALLMLNNNGHDHIFIKDQTGRSFYDGDGFSESASFPSSKLSGEFDVENLIPSGMLPYK